MPGISGLPQGLRLIVRNEALLEIARRTIENTLVDMRDNGTSTLTRGNGLVIKDRDGSASPVIRLGSEDAVRIGLRAIAIALEYQSQCDHTGEQMYSPAKVGALRPARTWCLRCGAEMDRSPA